MPEPLNPNYERWMIQLWMGLGEGTYWHVPRSDTTFQRQGDRLVFIEGDAHELGVVRDHFALIGVEVVSGPPR